VSERLDLVDRLQRAAGCPVDLVVLNDARLPLQFEIIRTGRVVYETGTDERTAFEDDVVGHYLDFEPMLSRSYAEMVECLRQQVELVTEERTGYGRRLAGDRLQAARRSLARLKELERLTLEEFLAEPDGYAVADHHLRRAMQAVLDLGRHLVVVRGWGNPGSYREVFDLLEGAGTLSRSLAVRGRVLAGARNRLVHDYAAVDEKEMWLMLQNSPADLSRLLLALAEAVGVSGY
jgi:uncharacterized protein YutE (UPF0331/DUF86 family)